MKWTMSLLEVERLKGLTWDFLGTAASSTHS